MPVKTSSDFSCFTSKVQNIPLKSELRHELDEPVGLTEEMGTALLLTNCLLADFSLKKDKVIH